MRRAAPPAADQAWPAGGTGPTNALGLLLPPHVAGLLLALGLGCLLGGELLRAKASHLGRDVDCVRHVLLLKGSSRVGGDFLVGVAADLA